MPKSATAECSATNLQTVLEQVKLEFVKGLGVQAVQLQQIWATLDAGHCACDLSAVSFMAHKICGLAKTVGYGELGNAAQALEAALSGSAAATPDSKEVARLIRRLIDEMRAVGSQDRS